MPFLFVFSLALGFSIYLCPWYVFFHIVICFVPGLLFALCLILVSPSCLLFLFLFSCFFVFWEVHHQYPALLHVFLCITWYGSLSSSRLLCIGWLPIPGFDPRLADYLFLDSHPAWLTTCFWTRPWLCMSTHSWTWRWLLSYFVPAFPVAPTLRFWEITIFYVHYSVWSGFIAPWHCAFKCTWTLNLIAT